MAASPPNPLPATNAPAAAPTPLSHEININITPETPLEATPSTALGAPPPAPASGSNADAKHEATGAGAGGIKEKLALTTTAGVASPSAAEEQTKEQPQQPRLSTTIPDDELDFTGSVDSNNDIPTAETLKRIENYMVLDKDGRSHSFKSLYSGSHAARRVLVIFVRHFFCGVSLVLLFPSSSLSTGTYLTMNPPISNAKNTSANSPPPSPPRLSSASPSAPSSP